MRQHLAQRFVHLCRVRLGAQRVPELALNHGKGGFHVAALVVMRQERLTVELAVVPYPYASV